MATPLPDPTPQRHHRRARPAIGLSRPRPVPHEQLAARLTARDRWILRMLAEHRVLTTPALTALAFPSSRAATGRLRELWEVQLLDRFQPFTGSGSAPLHHVLGPAGAAVIAAEEGLDPAQLGYRRDRALSVAHSLQLAHTVAVNDLLAHLTAYATAHAAIQPIAAPTARLDQAGLRVEVWWSAARCGHHIGDLVRPDAYLHLSSPAGGAGFEAFVEYDFATTNAARVAQKLDRYHHLATATGVATPVLVWCPSRHREPGLAGHLTRAHAALDRPDLVPVATAAPLPDQAPATGADGVAGAWAPVWRPLVPADRRRPATRVRPVGLVDLARMWPLRHPPGRALLGPTGLPHPDGSAGVDVGGDGSGGGLGRRAGLHALPAPPPVPPGGGGRG